MNTCKIPKNSRDKIQLLNIAELWNGGFNMCKKNISVTLDESLLETINLYAKSRYISRSSAIDSMLRNARVIVIEDGSEIIKLLYSLDTLLKNSRLACEDKKSIKEMCDEIWQLLNLITGEIRQAEEM